MKEKKSIQKLSYTASGKKFRGLLCMLTFCAFVACAVVSYYAIDTYGNEILKNPGKDFRESTVYQSDIENEMLYLLQQIKQAYGNEYGDGVVTVIDAYSKKAYDYDLGEIRNDRQGGSSSADSLEDLKPYLYKTNTAGMENDISDYYSAASEIMNNLAAEDFLYLDTDAFRNLFVQNGHRNKSHCYSDSFSENAYFVFDSLSNDGEAEFKFEIADGNATGSVSYQDISAQEYAVYDPDQEVFYSTQDTYFEPMDSYIYSVSELKAYLQSVDLHRTRYDSLLIPLLHSYNYPVEEMLVNPLEQYELMLQARSFLAEYDTHGGLYYFEAGEEVYTNAEDLSDIQSKTDWYCLTKPAGDSAVVYTRNTKEDSSMYGETVLTDGAVFFPKDITLYLSMEPGSGLRSERAIVRHFQEYSFYASYTVVFLVVAVLAFILLVVQAVWLIWTTGREGKKGEEVVLNSFDRIPTELWIFICGMVLVGSIFIACMNIGAISFADNIVNMWVVAEAAAVPFAFFFMILTLSLVRRIKAHNLWSRSLLYRLVWQLQNKNFWKRFRNLKGTHKLMVVFIAYVVVCTLCLVSVYWRGSQVSQWLWIIYLLTQLAAFSMVRYIIRDTDRMLQGIQEITRGNLDYKVEVNGKISLYSELSEGINHIGDGLKAAVETSLKDERMKTELITNVSHDLKTPLTSIINYINLLKTEKMPTPEAEHYVEVLDSKAWRLRQLTEDLVEAAKATSGNIELEMMPLAFNELMKQALGEFEDKFVSRDLTVVSYSPEESVMVMADGRRMYRIIENVLQNAYKYALSGTRIYADLADLDGTVTFTLKNISAAPLNIGLDELMERFTRGDAARTTEGSGLGLSIAKDLTRLQGGTFKIALDGDLFKVIIEFPQLKK